MIKSSLEKLAEEIGFDIGASDDVTQSKLLNGFCRGLNNSILQKYDMDMQMCYIAKNLDENSKIILLRLSEFLKENVSNK